MFLRLLLSHYDALPPRVALGSLHQLHCLTGFRLHAFDPRFFQKTFGTLRERHLKVKAKYPRRISITTPAKHTVTDRLTPTTKQLPPRQIKHDFLRSPANRVDADFAVDALDLATSDVARPAKDLGGIARDGL